VSDKRPCGRGARTIVGQTKRAELALRPLTVW
jgi:hypothetical protein